ncbi:MAG: hypothetical protein QM734_11515 [Cyclobacteriaceae bacterium]
MKPFTILLALFIAIITSCSHEETKIAATRNISFSFSQQARKGDKMSEGQLPAYVLISINDNQSKVVCENKKLPLLSFGQGYVSEDLQLKVGNYKLTKFLVLDSNDKIIYATPLEGSELTKYVDDPLPMDFTVTENGTATVTPQVLAVEDTDNPESFGYVNFGFEIVNANHGLIKKILLEEKQGATSLKYSIEYKYENNRLIEIDEYYCYPNWNSCDSTSRDLFLYDVKGRISKHIYVSNSNEKTTREFQYDDKGRLAKILNDQGYNWDKQTTFFYTGADTIPGYAIISTAAGSQSPSYRVEYNYDNAVGKLTLETYLFTSNVKKKQQTKTYTFDLKRRVYPNSFDLSTTSTFTLGTDEFPIQLGNIVSFGFTWYSYMVLSGVEQMTENQCNQNQIEYAFNNQGLIEQEFFHTNNLNNCSDYSTFPDGTVRKYQYEFY